MLNVDLMLGHRLRRWPNIKTTLVEVALHIIEFIPVVA